jgi:hypothetical protein
MFFSSSTSNEEKPKLTVTPDNKKFYKELGEYAYKGACVGLTVGTVVLIVGTFSAAVAHLTKQNPPAA